MDVLKMWAQVVATALLALSAAVTGGLTLAEWVAIGIAIATAVNVYVVPNIPQYPYTKTIVAVVLAILNSLVLILGDGFQTTDLIQIAIVALGAAGVYGLENKGDMLWNLTHSRSEPRAG